MVLSSRTLLCMLRRFAFVAPLLGVLLVAGSALADDIPSPKPSKDRGCGCETAGNTHTYAGLSLAFMGLGLVLFRRSLRPGSR